jgi:hypothetical protein
MDGNWMTLIVASSLRLRKITSLGEPLMSFSRSSSTKQQKARHHLWVSGQKNLLWTSDEISPFFRVPAGDWNPQRLWDGISSALKEAFPHENLFWTSKVPLANYRLPAQNQPYPRKLTISHVGKSYRRMGFGTPYSEIIILTIKTVT